jgi:hypothetical protein
MADPTTRDGEMTTDEANKLERIARAIGKHNNTKDPRVTTAFQWIAGVGSALMVVLLTWIGATLVQMRQDIAVIKAESSPKSAQLDRVEGQINDIRSAVASVDRRLVLVEARQK